MVEVVSAAMNLKNNAWRPLTLATVVLSLRQTESAGWGLVMPREPISTPVPAVVESSHNSKVPEVWPGRTQVENCVVWPGATAPKSKYL